MAATDLQNWLYKQGIPTQPVASVLDRTSKVPTECGSLRVQFAGSWLLQLANHPTTTPFEHSFRKLPQDGIFAATPERPSVIELGAFPVPASMVLLVLDWRFDIYRPNGAIVGDVVPIEERRLALQIGWDVVFTAKRTANIEYEITPSPPTIGSLSAYKSNPNAGIIPDNFGIAIPPASQVEFDRIRFLQTQEPSGLGASMLPQRHRRDVQPQMPFTYILEENQTIQFLNIAFQPVPIPIAFFEVEFSGLLLGSNAFKEFIKGSNPCVGY
jgi:hypothetical protein